MNTEQLRTEFEAWAASIGLRVNGKYAGTIAVLCAETAFEAGYKAALQSQDREDAERYRWLRENWFTMGSTYKDDQIQFYINGPRYSNATEAELDAAIDHARRVEGDGE